MKKLLVLSVLFCTSFLTAQEKNVTYMAGYKAFEISITYTAENELIYGLAISAIDAKFSESIADAHDIKQHNFKGDIVPAVHGLIGGKYDKTSFIGKIGCAKITQSIDGKPEPKNIYLSYGLMVRYEFENEFSVVGSIDATNAIMAGISYKF